MRAADGGDSARFIGFFLASSFFCSQTFIYARPLSAANASRWLAPIRKNEYFSMMLSMLLAPNTPDWLLLTVLVLSLGSLLGMMIWAMILEIRYISPFTIIKTSNKEKWRQAAILAFLQTTMIPILGLAQPTLSPRPDQWPVFPLFCGGIWIVVLPIATLYKRWEFERHIKNYQRLDKMIKDKDGIYHRLFSSPFTSWTRIFMTADQKRFFSEGFPDDVYEKKDSEAPDEK